MICTSKKKNVFIENPSDLKTQIFDMNSNQAIAVQSDSRGNLLVKQVRNSRAVNELPLTSFHDLRCTELTPVTGWTFNYNINSDLIVTSTGGLSGSVTQSNSKAQLNTGTRNSGFAKIATRGSLRYNPGLGSLVRFTAVFITGGKANSSQIIGIGDDEDGFFFGFNNLDFGILRIQNGVYNWDKQSNWNVDILNGIENSAFNLNTATGNVYAIEYQWLGFGVISFYLASPIDGAPILVHRIEYPNTSTIPSVLNPSFPIMAKVLNSGNTQNITLETASAMAFVEGSASSQAIVTRNSAFSSTKTILPTDTNILTIQNNTIFKGKTNRVRINIDFISASTDGFNSVRFKVIRNATFGILPIYTPINENTSVVQESSTFTTATNGTLLLAFEVGKISDRQLFIDSLNLFLAPGETLTISATSSGNTNIDLSFGWQELW